MTYSRLVAALRFLARSTSQTSRRGWSRYRRDQPRQPPSETHPPQMWKLPSRLSFDRAFSALQTLHARAPARFSTPLTLYRMCAAVAAPLQAVDCSVVRARQLGIFLWRGFESLGSSDGWTTDVTLQGASKRMPPASLPSAIFKVSLAVAASIVGVPWHRQRQRLRDGVAAARDRCASSQRLEALGERLWGIMCSCALCVVILRLSTLYIYHQYVLFVRNTCITDRYYDPTLIPFPRWVFSQGVARRPCSAPP